MIPTARRGLLFVHAHPDDETINNGVTMARYAAEGVHVTLVTCTRGEFGEILVPELEHLAWDREDRLGEYRETELATAMKALGVTDHRFLAPPEVYHDSGMMGTPSNDASDAFWQADVEEAAARLVAIIRETTPQVLVTYDEHGGYGHPDHIQAHRVAMRAAELAADPDHGVGEAHAISKIYWNALPRSVLRAGVEALRAVNDRLGFDEPESVDEAPFVVDDAMVTAAIDGSAFVERKIEAMRAHATQISVNGMFFALSNNLGQQISSFEYYRQVSGPRVAGADGWESDLFAGL